MAAHQKMIQNHLHYLDVLIGRTSGFIKFVIQGFRLIGICILSKLSVVWRVIVCRFELLQEHLKQDLRGTMRGQGPDPSTAYCPLMVKIPPNIDADECHIRGIGGIFTARERLTVNKSGPRWPWSCRMIMLSCSLPYRGLHDITPTRRRTLNVGMGLWTIRRLSCRRGAGNLVEFQKIGKEVKSGETQTQLLLSTTI